METPNKFNVVPFITHGEKNCDRNFGTAANVAIVSYCINLRIARKQTHTHTHAFADFKEFSVCLHQALCDTKCPMYNVGAGLYKHCAFLTLFICNDY